jgi:hypothetical protein
MPAAWTEDPSIGNALAGLANNFSGLNAATMANTVEEIKKKRAQAAAATAADQANRVMWNARTPPDVAPNLAAWRAGGGTVGTEVVPAGGPASLQPYTPDITERDTGAQQQANAEFARVRAKQLADSSLGYQHVTSMGDVATNAPKMEAGTQLDLYGVPRTLEGQLKMETQLTGKLPMVDVTGTTSNYGVQDQQGNIVARGSTRDGRTDMASGQAIAVPPGHSLVKMGDAPFDQSPYKDKGAELNALEALNRKATIGQPEQWTLNDQQRSQILLSSQFPQAQKVEKDDSGNIRVVGFNEKVVPPVYAPLIARLNSQLGYLQPPPGAPAGGAPPAPTTAPAAPAPAMPGQRPGLPDALASVAGPGAAPATTAAAPPPIVPFNPNATSVSAPLVSGSGDPQLKEVLNNPAYQRAVAAGTAYNAINEAFKTDSPAADLHGIYMLAKIFDPQSAVREGELAMAANTGSGAEQLWGTYNKLVNGEGRLSPDQRKDFEKQAYVAATQHYNAAKDQVDYAQGRAKLQGLDPKLVAPPLTAPVLPATAAVNTEKRGVMARPLPKVGDIMNGRTYLGGDPGKRESWR